MRKLVSTAALWLLYVPLAHAQSLNNGSLDTIGNAAYGGQKTPLPLIVGNMIKTFIGLLGIVFLVLTVYAGFLYLTAQDDADKVTHAKETLQRGVIGIVIVLAAYAISAFVVNALVVTTKAN